MTAPHTTPAGAPSTSGTSIRTAPARAAVTRPASTPSAPAPEPRGPWLRRVLVLDAVVGTFSGVAVTAFAAPLAPQLDVGSSVVVAIGLLFVVAGLVNGWAARGDVARLPALLAVDLDVVGAAVSVTLLLRVSPTSLGTALLALTAVWTTAIAVIKLVGLRGQAGGRVAGR